MIVSVEMIINFLNSDEEIDNNLTDLPVEARKMLYKFSGKFINIRDGENYKILDSDETGDPLKHFGVDCKKKGIFPLVDCKENNFLVYNLADKSYEMFDIVDEVPFDKFNSLLDFWQDSSSNFVNSQRKLK
jgi:hypothetical protein